MQKKAKKNRKEEGRKENADCLHSSATFGLHLPQSVLSSPYKLPHLNPFFHFNPLIPSPSRHLPFSSITPSLTHPPFSYFLLTNLRILLPSSTPIISFSISPPNFHFLSLFNEASFVGSFGFHFLALHVNPFSLSLPSPLPAFFSFSLFWIFSSVISFFGLWVLDLLNCKIYCLIAYLCYLDFELAIY